MDNLFYSGRLSDAVSEWDEKTVYRFRKLIFSFQNYFDKNFENCFEILINKSGITATNDSVGKDAVNYFITLKLLYLNDKWIDIKYEDIIATVKSLDVNYTLMEHINDYSFLKHEKIFFIIALLEKAK